MSMDYYRGMLIQRTRIEAFQRQIAAVVQPGDRVLEIGAGLGTYSLFAAEAGAAKVWAVEGAPIVSVAKSIARLNGYHDRVEFLRGWFPEVRIPEPIDVLIFEDYSPRLLDQWTFTVLAQLHRDIVTPNTRVVPDRARMYLAPVRVDRNWELIGRLGGERDTAYGIDWTPCREYIYNTPLAMPIAPDDLQHDPVEVADVRLDRLPDPTTLTGDADWTFEQPTTVHGLAYWFAFEVGADVWLTNRPGGDPGSWGYLYLPCAEPLTIPAGGTLHARVAPEISADGAPSWLTWELRTGDQHFAGHEFRSFPASLADLVPTSPSWIPKLNHHGRLEQRILSLADGTRSIEQITALLSGTDSTLDPQVALSTVLSTLQGRAEEPTDRPGLA